MDVDSSIPEKFFKSLNEYRNDKLYFDLALESNDQHRVSVHKIVLATCPYFECKLKNMNLHNVCKFETINVSISGKQLEIVVNYLYTGEVNVTEFSERKALYETAHEFQLEFLKDYSTNQLIKSISPSFVLEYWRHSVKYNIKNLKSKCLEFMAANTKQFFYEYLKELTEPEFLEIIESRKEFQLAEIDFYSNIKNWIFLHYYRRKHYVESILLAKVDYSKIDIEIIEQEIYKDKKLMSHSEFLMAISDIIIKSKAPTTNYPVVPFATEENKTATIETNQLAFMFKLKSVYLVNKSNLEIHKINIESRKTALECVPSENSNWHSTCNVQNEYIFFSGGKDYNRKGFKKNYLWKPSTPNHFIRLPDLLKERYRHKVIFSNNQIYACGSLGLCRSTEIYNFNTNLWMQGPDLLTHKPDFGLTSLDNNLYAITRSVERLDSRDRQNKWEKISNDYSSNLVQRCIPINDNQILCMHSEMTLREWSIFDIRTCSFSQFLSLPEMISKNYVCSDFFQLNNTINIICTDDNRSYIYKYDNNNGWIDPKIFIETDIKQFDAISLEN